MSNFEVIHKEDSIRVLKETGTEVNYYIFDESEIHLNKIMPHSIQEWHYHEKIDETLLITRGKLLCKYIDEDGLERFCYAARNDIVKVHDSVHTFENDTDDITEFIVFRFVPDGRNKRDLIKSDKTIVKR